MAKPRFIKLALKDHIIVHGFDKNNKQIEEVVSVPNFTEKIIAIDRIKSLSEKYILTDYLDGRWIYWEYKESFEFVAKKIV